jgi:hypothetical protein
MDDHGIRLDPERVVHKIDIPHDDFVAYRPQRSPIYCPILLDAFPTAIRMLSSTAAIARRMLYLKSSAGRNGLRNLCVHHCKAK